MTKKELTKLIDEIFVPLNFKRKGNNWVLNGAELNKIVNLQQSNYGNFFYINYGYIIRGLELTTRLHVENRLGSLNKDEQKRITDLLDLDFDISPEKRLLELRSLISNEIASKLKLVNTQSDLLTELKQRPHLLTLPFVVKKHFGLE